MTGALEGIRVLDLATGSFALAGRLLAGLGAEVVKVEPPGGDPMRCWPPHPGDDPNPETGARHLHLDAAKHSVVIDLETPEGADLLRRLVREADALIESFEPGYLAERGLAYDDLVRERSDLVMASVTHFGQDGPYAGYRGAEIVDCAIGGYLKLNGDPDREPVKPYDDLVLQHAALHTAVAVMTGITHRDVHGEGDYFDVAAVEAALLLLGGLAQSYHFDGHIPQRAGARLLFSNPKFSYPSTLRPCRDGWVHVHSNNRNPDLLAVLMPDMGLEELLDTPFGNRDQIDEIMDRWLADKDRTEAVRLAQEVRLPFTEVFTPQETVRDAHLEARGALVEIDHPVAPRVRQPGPAALLSETPWRTERAPLTGEHSDEVLRDLLGMSEDEVEALRQSGVVA